MKSVFMLVWLRRAVVAVLEWVYVPLCTFGIFYIFESTLLHPLFVANRNDVSDIDTSL